MKLARREFLGKVGLGSIALGSIPILANALATPALAAGERSEKITNFRFLSVSAARPIGGEQPRINISGDGKITPEQVVGGGSFNLFDAATPVPKKLLLFGTWKAKHLISFNKIGDYGALAAGVLEMEILLVPVAGFEMPATLKVACNIPAGGLLTKPFQEEGATLTITGTPFGPFAPVPDSALSIFTTGVEERG